MANDYQTLRKFAFKFKFKKRGYKPDQGVIDMCNRLATTYAKVHKKLKMYNILYDPDKNERENMKRTSTTEKIVDKLLDFYKALDHVIKEFVSAVFLRPNTHEITYMRGVLEYLNNILRICFRFDHDRNNYESLFHDFSLRKQLTPVATQYTREYLFQTSLFCACSMPMATLFVTQFVSPEKYIKNDFYCRKEALLMNKQRKRFMYLICCITRKEKNLRYCFLFFSGTYCNYYQSEYVEYIAKELEKDKRKYFMGMKRI
ncbi:hypothetical protein VCUG_01916 [Vavraia culicis subsp. floridensis]|uniref:Uncharacterized protein n=1 Tax=Vavraia culicis (isolate floridensis) TaxID=948595 RepID=L2GSE5_VAVCU|nr:uncharacterized protein VCUG_01916 [Vavraia culicis subsp. floridensis]ELA46586.1 hypothetical protein VCUG_01916 [Vavraia culicis subsp. floridensis]